MESRTQEQAAVGGFTAQTGNRGDRSDDRDLFAQMSSAEMAAFRKWQSDSFWYKCVPMSGFLIFSSEYLIRRGRLKIIGRYQPWLRIPFMIMNGFILGRMMSVRELQSRMVAQFPDGAFAQALKRGQAARENMAEGPQGMGNMAEGQQGPTGQEAKPKGTVQKYLYDGEIPEVFREKPRRKSYYDRFREEEEESSSDTKTGFPKPPPKEPLFFTEKKPEGRHTGKKTKYGDAWEE